MEIMVNGEKPFKAQKGTLCIEAGAAFTLNYSASKDGGWTAYTESTPANETLIVNGVTPFMWFKLAGNTDTERKIIV